MSLGFRPPRVFGLSEVPVALLIGRSVSPVLSRLRVFKAEGSHCCGVGRVLAEGS